MIYLLSIPFILFIINKSIEEAQKETKKSEKKLYERV